MHLYRQNTCKYYHPMSEATTSNSKHYRTSLTSCYLSSYPSVRLLLISERRVVETPLTKRPFNVICSPRPSKLFLQTNIIIARLLSTNKHPSTEAVKMSTNIPAGLKTADISRFVTRAAQLEKAKPTISYWCMLHQP